MSPTEFRDELFQILGEISHEFEAKDGEITWMWRLGDIRVRVIVYPCGQTYFDIQSRQFEKHEKQNVLDIIQRCIQLKKETTDGYRL